MRERFTPHTHAVYVTTACPTGNFTGATGVAAELTWTDAAANASALQMVAPAVRAMAATGALAYEAHHFGVWLPDFLCASPESPHTAPSPPSPPALQRVFVRTMNS